MKGLSPRTWKLVKIVFPSDASTAGQVLLEECGQNLPFCENSDKYDLERLRFAALKVSKGSLDKLREAVDLAKLDWRDLLMWAGFGTSITAHEEWAETRLKNKKQRRRRHSNLPQPQPGSCLF